MTLNLAELVTDPPRVVTLMVPVVAPAGTVAVILEYESTVKLAETPWNLTEVAPAKAVPVMTTLVPTGPLVGLNPLMVGATLKVESLVATPAGVTTFTLPVRAPNGTVAVIWP